jgi:hypothetical protein
MPSKIGSFTDKKGITHPVIIMYKEGKEDAPYPFSVGKAKAKLFIENYEAVKKFAESSDEEDE